MPTVGGLRLTTVLTPAPSTALTTLAAFKQELCVQGSDDDAYIGTLIANASAAVARYCNRVFPVETVLDEIWPERDVYPYQVPTRLVEAQLARWPVVGTPQVVVDGGLTLVSGVGFRTDACRGAIIRLGACGEPLPWGARYLAVTYSGGYETIPPDVVDAVTRMMKQRWFARMRDPGLRSESIAGVYEASYWFASGPGANGNLPPDVVSILDAYRVPVVA